MGFFFPVTKWIFVDLGPGDIRWTEFGFPAQRAQINECQEWKCQTYFSSCDADKLSDRPLPSLLSSVTASISLLAASI